MVRKGRKVSIFPSRWGLILSMAWNNYNSNLENCSPLWWLVGGTTLIIIKLFGEFDSVFKTVPANSIFPGSKYRWGEVLNNFLNILKKLWGIQLPNFMLWWKNICSWHGLWSFKIENHKFFTSTFFYIRTEEYSNTSFSCFDYFEIQIRWIWFLKQTIGSILITIQVLSSKFPAQKSQLKICKLRKLCQSF